MSGGEGYYGTISPREADCTEVTYMATIPTVVPLLTDAWRIYSTSTPQDKQSMEETLSSIIVNYASMSSKRVPNSVLYEQDFFEWTRTTAVLLRAGKRDDIDWHTLAEEIESMGASQYDAVSSAVYQILVHLLKWYYQPDRRSNSWRASVVEHRNRISRKLRRSPSLVPKIPLMIMEEYPGACRKASAQTGLPLTAFPPSCPWTEEQVRSDDFWPETTS